jgi:lysophospholipase L1-like esterase
LVLGAAFMYKVGVHVGQWGFWSTELAPFAEATRRLAKKFDAVFLDFPALFARAEKVAPIQHWVWDGCHPSQAGHELMTREWLKVVSGRLPFLKIYA